MIMDTKDILLNEEDTETAYLTLISFLTDEEARTLVARMIHKSLQDNVEAWDAFFEANSRVKDMARDRSRLHSVGYLEYMHELRAADNDRSDALDEALAAQKRLNVLLQKYGAGMTKITGTTGTTETTTETTIHIKEDDDDDE